MLVIEAPYFYAACLVEMDLVEKAAPIIKYMIGWSVTEVEAYCRKKDWKVLRYA